jgi:hypothetical protein
MHGHQPDSLPDKRVPRHPVHRLANPDRPGRCHLLQPYSQVRGIALHSIVQPQVVPDPSYDDGAGMQTQPHLQRYSPTALDFPLVLAQGSLDAERGVQGTSRVIFVSNRRTEQDHDAVVGELGDGACISADLLSEEGEAPTDERQQVFRVEALYQHTAPCNRRTQNGDLFALAFQGAAHRQDLVGEAARGAT